MNDAELMELCEAQRLLIEAQSVLIKDQWKLIGALGGKVPQSVQSTAGDMRARPAAEHKDGK